MIAFAPAINTFHDVARQWPDEVRRRVDAAVAAAAAARHAVRTAPEARAYAQRVRDAFWSTAGGLPGRPAEDAHARSGAYEDLGSLTHLGVRITRLTYESLPGVPVSALLYRPEANAEAATGRGRRPGVVFLCGHYGSAKHHPEFQRVCLDLALHGVVALAIDPWGQGERLQYAAPGSWAGDPPLVPPGTFEHSYTGLQCHLTGGGVTRYFAWDAVRAVDVLAAQPDVDPARIGAAGNSGGGTQTVLLMLADDRLAAAMPCTYITGMAWLYRTGQTLDAEMSHPGALAQGIDHADLLAGFAPRPLLVGAAAYDYFPIEGAEQAVEEARHIYALLGAGERIGLAVDAARHAFTDRLREAAVRFFTRELAGAERYVPRDLPALPEPELWCSPTGQLYRDRPGLRGVFELNRAFLEAHSRTPPASAGEAAASLERALGAMPALDATPIRPRYFAPAAADGYVTQQVFWFSEPEVCVTGTLLRPVPGGPAAPAAAPGAGAAEPDRRRETAVAPAGAAPGLARGALDGGQHHSAAGSPAGPRTWLVLLPHGTASAEEALVEAIALARGGETALVFDPRGRGAVASVPLTRYAPYDSWLGQEGWTSYVEMQLGRTSLASRVYDVRRAVSFLEQFEGASGTVAVRGEGVAALWGYLAAALDDRVRTAHFTGLLPSWEEIVQTRLFDSNTITAAMVIPGVLQQLDLPDLRQCFAGRDLRIEAPLRAAALPEQLPLKRNA